MRTRLYYEALALAVEAHAGASYGGLPFWVHPVAVADTLAAHGVDDPITLAAALLHDVVEDTPITADAIEARFGPEVAGVVAEVTDDKSLPKSERTEQQILKAARFSAEAIAVKAADRCVNLNQDLGQQVPSGARVEHSRRLHDALRARCRELNAGPAFVKVLNSLDRTVRRWEDGRGTGGTR